MQLRGPERKRVKNGRRRRGGVVVVFVVVGGRQPARWTEAGGRVEVECGVVGAVLGGGDVGLRDLRGWVGFGAECCGMKDGGGGGGGLGWVEGSVYD